MYLSIVPFLSLWKWTPNSKLTSPKWLKDFGGEWWLGLIFKLLFNILFFIFSLLFILFREGWFLFFFSIPEISLIFPSLLIEIVSFWLKERCVALSLLYFLLITFSLEIVSSWLNKSYLALVLCILSYIYFYK